MLGTKKQTFALDCGLGVAVKLIWLYFTTQLKLFLSTEIFTWFLSVLKKLFAQIFAQKYWQIFILNIQSLKVTLLPSFLKYATINSSQKKDQLLSFKRKRPYLSGSLSLRTSCTLKNNNTTNCSFFFLNCFLLLMHLSLIVELPAKTERNIKMATRYDSENLFNILVGSI